MYTTRAATACPKLTSTTTATQALKALHGLSGVTVVSLRPASIAVQQYHVQPWNNVASRKRHFSTTKSMVIKEFFPEKETQKVRKTPAAWDHPM